MSDEDLQRAIAESLKDVAQHEVEVHPKVKRKVKKVVKKIKKVKPKQDVEEEKDDDYKIPQVTEQLLPSRYQPPPPVVTVVDPNPRPPEPSEKAPFPGMSLKTVIKNGWVTKEWV